MNLLIQIETTERRDMTSLVAAVAAYIATFAKVDAVRSARHFERTDRSGTMAVVFHELAVEPRGEVSGAELTAAVAKFMRDILRRSAQTADVGILVGASGVAADASPQ